MIVQNHMYRIHYYLPVLAVLFIVLLTGCTSSSDAGTGPKTTPTPATVNGYGTAHGCPSDLVVTAVPKSANILLQSTNINAKASAHVGDIIEIHLPFGQRWTGPMIVDDTVELQQPAGYAWKDANACVWRFVAKKSGSTELSFSGQAICEPGKMCPMYISNNPFTIDIK